MSDRPMLQPLRPPLMQNSGRSRSMCITKNNRLWSPAAPVVHRAQLKAQSDCGVWTPAPPPAALWAMERGIEGEASRMERHSIGTTYSLPDTARYLPKKSNRSIRWGEVHSNGNPILTTVRYQINSKGGDSGGPIWERGTGYALGTLTGGDIDESFPESFSPRLRRFRVTLRPLAPWRRWEIMANPCI